MALTGGVEQARMVTRRGSAGASPSRRGNCSAGITFLGCYSHAIGRWGGMLGIPCHNAWESVMVGVVSRSPDRAIRPTEALPASLPAYGL